MCRVGQVRLSVRVSYEECCVAVSLLERVSVWCWTGRSVSVCVLYEECRVAVGLLERLSMWCSAGPSVCVCVSYEECRLAVGLPDSECVVLGRSVYVCVSYEECRVAVNVLERVSVWCWAGPSVCACVIRGMPSSCRSAGESECVVLGRSVCVCVSYEECWRE